MMEWNMEHLQTQNLFMKNKLNTDFPSVEQNGGPFNRVDKQHPQTILVLRKRENFKQFLRGNLARKRMPGHNKSSKNGNYSLFFATSTSWAETNWIKNSSTYYENFACVIFSLKMVASLCPFSSSHSMVVMFVLCGDFHWLWLRFDCFVRSLMFRLCSNKIIFMSFIIFFLSLLALLFSCLAMCTQNFYKFHFDIFRAAWI